MPRPRAFNTAGSNNYFIVRQGDNVCRAADSTMVPFVAADVDLYDLPLTPLAAGLMEFVGTFPAALAAGTYMVTCYERVGAVPDLAADVVIDHVEEFYWSPTDGALTVPEAVDAEMTTSHGTGSWAGGGAGGGTITFSQVAAIVAAAEVSEGAIAFRRGDTVRLQITDLGSLAGRTKLWFTAKADPEDADSASILQITEDGGLLYLNGAAAGTPSQGSITVDDEETGDISVELEAAAATSIPFGNYLYDVQILTPDGVSTLAEGTLEVKADVTRAVV